MICQKCQLRFSQNVHGPVTMDMFKMIRRFFLHMSKMGLFRPKFLVKKFRNSSNDEN